MEGHVCLDIAMVRHLNYIRAAMYTVAEVRARRDERIKVLREAIQITEEHGEPASHFALVNLLNEAEKT